MAQIFCLLSHRYMFKKMALQQNIKWIVLHSVPEEWGSGSKFRFYFNNVLCFNRVEVGPTIDPLFRDIYPIPSYSADRWFLFTHNEMKSVNIAFPLLMESTFS